MIEWLFHQSSQALGLLAFVGVLAALYRWKRATHRDFLLSLLLFMAGTSLREIIVYAWGNVAWDDAALVLSTLARGLQIGGAVMFIRFATRDACPPWVMVAFLVLVVCIVVVV